jgi:eukaryotic-like serine/threonine-protein kinase
MAMVLNPAARRLGRYELVSYLGSGGMSDVYVALHTGLRKRVALKLLRPSLRYDVATVQRFLREGESAARVRHPNVVDVSDVGMEDGTPYLVMELLEGETLADKLEREGALGIECAVDILLPILDAVAAVHAAGVLHRDVKPSNIVLARAVDGSLQPKLVDFGIALLREDSPDEDRKLGPLGTPHYMSPEQARGDDIDERSDQFSIGSVMFEMLTAREPFAGGSVEAVMREVARGRFPRLTSALKSAPPELEEVLARATARAPGQRYACVSDLAHALVPFASERTRRLFVSREERAGLFSAQLLSGAFRTDGVPPRREAVSMAGSFAPRARSRRLQRMSLRALAGSAMLGLGLMAGFGVTQGAAEEGQPVGRREVQTREPLRAQPALAAPPQRTVRLVPAEASAALDGKELGRGSFVIPQLSADLHELRISAPGHVARVMLFRGGLAEGTIALERKRR